MQQLLVLDTEAADVTVHDVAARPIASINRNFSAPVTVDTDRTPTDLAFLSGHDDDPFARYEAMQQLMLDALLSSLAGAPHDDQAIVEAVGATLADPALDPAFVAEAVMLPSESFIGDQMTVADPDAIAAVREALRSKLGVAHVATWRALYAKLRADEFVYSPSAKGARRLRNVALGYLAAAKVPDHGTLAYAQFEAADNMTDRMAALMTLANGDSDRRIAALDIFYNRYRDNPLVIDKWFTTQALSTRDDTLDAVLELTQHRDFTRSNPNRFRALVGAFSVNQRAFNAAGGRGYDFLADQIVALDKINPQTAAKTVPPLGRWRRFDAKRQALMRAALARIVDAPGLSKDVFEQASKSLA